MRRLLSFVMVLIILAPLLAGLWLLIETARFVWQSEPAIGTVTSATEAVDRMFYAHFTYTDATGAEQTGSTAWASIFNELEPGTTLPLRYLPQNPKVVLIATPMRVWGLPLVILGPTLLMYVLGIALYRRTHPKVSAEDPPPLAPPAP